MKVPVNLAWWSSWYLHGDPQPAARVLSDYDIPYKAEQRRHTLTLVDWDDTLFPTSSLRATGADVRRDSFSALPSDTRARLARLEREAIALLVAAAVHGGAVKVVTVASASWVRDAAARLMPNLRAYMRDARIEVQSARDDYAAHRGDDPHTWKYWAFRHQLAAAYPGSQDVDVIVIGDGAPERYAARSVAEDHPELAVKLVRIAPVESVDGLAVQIAFTHHAFHELEVNFDSVEVELELE